MCRQVGAADRFFKLAKAQGYVARSAFKLIELQKKHNLIRRGGTVLDLGCSPGSWLQVACQAIGPPHRGGLVVGVDIQDARSPEQHVDAERVRVLQADVRTILPSTLRTLLPPSAAGYDAILSDMAPSTSGVIVADVAQSLDLAQCAADLALGGNAPLLAPHGNLVVKVLEGHGLPKFVKQLQPCFHRVLRARPKATRSESREIYVLGLCHDP